MILLTGGTGTVGSELAQLLSRTEVPTRALVRNPEKATALSAAGIELVQGDLAKPDSLPPAFDGAEKLFLLTGPDATQVALQAHALRAARDAGVRYVVKLSVIGAAPDAPMQLGRWHAETDRLVAQMGVGYAVLQPQSFMQNLLMSAPGIAATGEFYGCTGEGKYAVVDARDIAAVAAALLTGSGTKDGAYQLTGPEALSGPDMARQLSTATGQDIRYVDVPPERYKEGLVGAGVPAWLADDLVTLNQIYAAGHGAAVSDTIARVTGRPAHSFAQFAEDHRAAFTGPA